MEILSKGYRHQEVEPAWYDLWVSRGYFTADPNSDKPPFSIAIPPPNVTGALHMGHALTFTIQDIIVRFKRMCGYNTLWLPGTDHAGIATQMVVERDLLAKRGLTRFDLGREAFLREVWAWKKKAHARITAQMKALGISVDWSRERFTLDEGLSRAVRAVFVRLYNEGLIYRARRMVNWSPAIRTVLSDLEVEEREVMGHLYYIAYPVVGSDEKVIVATTRPETMLGDTAVAVHPDDDRYKHLIGRMVHLPLCDRQIPVIADPIAVDPKFGTGAVKITPAHDFADFETGQRHNLPIICIFTDDARINENAPPKYRGLDRFEAREAVLRDLRSLGLLVRVEDYKHIVGHCQRSQVPVEPMVSMQWFVKMKPLAEPAIEVVRNKSETDPDKRIVFIPDHWEKVYFQWMENIRDWCISRQLWWGHQIPVWYCQTAGCDGIYVGMEAPSMEYQCPKCGGRAFKQDEDVLDTWFSSALWPFSTLGWPDDTPDLRVFYPTSVMETGFDIIFFWVARMIMMGLHFTGKVPFRTVYFHAMVRDEYGKKMSKTKGNVIDPMELVESVGADALRFTLAVLTAQGRDVKLSLEKVQGYREFVNKIWNAARFITMNMEGFSGKVGLDGLNLSSADKWVLTRTGECLAKVKQALEDFKFNEAANALYQFVWHSFCDWYIEMAKGALGEGGERRSAAQNVLVFTFSALLRALHPFMPFVTEELWQKFKGYLDKAPEHIVVADFPSGSEFPRWDDEAQAMDEVFALVSAIRGVRSQAKVQPADMIRALVVPRDEEVLRHIHEHRADVERLARLQALEIVQNHERTEAEAVSVLPFGDIFVEIGEDRVNAVVSLLEKEMNEKQGALEVTRQRLSNPNFLAKAKEDVIEELREREKSLSEALERIKEGLRSFGRTV